MTSAAPNSLGDGQPHDVVVVGSLNIDHTTRVRSIPRPGETVLGDDVRTFMGGKGLNQAVAAARAGASVAMVGRVGDDEGGRRLRNRLRSDGVDDTWVGVDDRSPTGAAFITVDANSENAIVVSPGANAMLTADHVAAADVVGRARVVLVQLEVPMAAVAATVATATGAVIVNPAPARPLPRMVIDRTAILIPNRSELAAIAGRSLPANGGESENDIVSMASTLIAGDGNARQVIVTLGADGVMLVDRTGPQRFAARPVDAVDTTGAGDCFCGSLAARLALGEPTVDAVVWAMTAASISVTRAGASSSMPTAAEVAEALA